MYENKQNVVDDYWRSVVDTRSRGIDLSIRKGAAKVPNAMSVSYKKEGKDTSDRTNYAYAQTGTYPKEFDCFVRVLCPYLLLFSEWALSVVALIHLESSIAVGLMILTFVFNFLLTDILERARAYTAHWDTFLFLANVWLICLAFDFGHNCFYPLSC